MSNDEVLTTHPPTLNVTTPSTQNGHRHRIFEADYPEGVFWKTPPRDDATDISYARRARAGLPISVCTQKCVFKPGGFCHWGIRVFLGNWKLESVLHPWVKIVKKRALDKFNTQPALYTVQRQQCITLSVSRSVGHATTRIPVSVGVGTLYSSRGRRRNYVQI